MDDIELRPEDEPPTEDSLREGTWYAGETWIGGGGADNIPIDERDRHFIGAECPCRPIVFDDGGIRVHRIGRLPVPKHR